MVGYHQSNDFIPAHITNEILQTYSGLSRTSSTSESPSTVVPVNPGVSHTPTSSTSRAPLRPRRFWSRRASTAASSESTTPVSRAAQPRATGPTAVAGTKATGLTVVTAGTKGATVTVTLADTRGVAATRSPSEESKLR
jgi:hypothetical protein